MAKIDLSKLTTEEFDDIEEQLPAERMRRFEEKREAIIQQAQELADRYGKTVKFNKQIKPRAAPKSRNSGPSGGQDPEESEVNDSLKDSATSVGIDT